MPAGLSLLQYVVKSLNSHLVNFKNVRNHGGKDLKNFENGLSKSYKHLLLTFVPSF